MKLTDITNTLFGGVGATLLIFFTTLDISLPLGLLLTFPRMSKNKIISGVTSFFISVLRGTPLMLQLIVWFFGPYYIFGIRLSTNWRVMSVLIGFSINYAAYFAEIYRSGIQSIGYSKSQTFIKIICPQMIKIVIPPVTNEVISLVKDTSLAFVVAYSEMFTIAKQVAAAETTIVPLFIAGAFYYIFNYIVAFVSEKIEESLNYY